MEGVLKQQQIDYVLYHLNYYLKITPGLKQKMRFEVAGENADGTPEHASRREPGTIVFTLSPRKFNREKVLYLEDLPVLFPAGSDPELFSLHGSTLVFRHDLLKSAFYLLSGYQEFNVAHRDALNRFRFEDSVQHKLGFTSRPLVNEYFQVIARGIARFCEDTGIPFEPTRLFDDFGFILTHDVDIVDTYTLHDLLYRFKTLLGWAPRRHSWKRTLYFFFHYLINYLKIFRRPNPHWDFDYLVGTAKKRGFTPVFFFLRKDLKHKDSYYHFSDKRIVRLFRYLNETGCEIGLHGSTRTSTQLSVLEDQIQSLETNAGVTVKGIRQHRLIHLQSVTSRLHQKSGLLYDSSLGFAEHEGFRNSFCLPFKPYDFENEIMIDLWEIPLVVMDATLYLYRGLDPVQGFESVKNLVEECRKHHGVFTLLWHNGNFDREHYPGGRELFEKILSYLHRAQCQPLTGTQCIEHHILPIFDSGISDQK